MTSCLLIGAGVTGLALAERLLLEDHAVTLFDRGNVGGESSWAGGGILSPLCPWDYPEEVTRLTGFGQQQYALWAASLHHATGIDPEFEPCGMLVLPPVDRDRALQWCRDHQFNVIDREDGLLLPDVAQVRNPRLVQALRRRVELLGGKIYELCEVQRITVEAGRVARIFTACGEFQADRYVVTAGAWSRQLLGEYALQLDIRPIRGQMLLFKFEAPPIEHILLQDGLYLIPRRDGHLLVGSTLEDVGFNKDVTQEAKRSLIQRAQKLLPALKDMQPIMQWSGLRPGSPGNIPTMDRHPDLENLYVNTGHFRYGVTMAPASAEILFNLVENLPQPFDISPYKLNIIK